MIYLVKRCVTHVALALCVGTLGYITVAEALAPDALLAVLYGLVAVVMAIGWWLELRTDVRRLRPYWAEIRADARAARIVRTKRPTRSGEEASS